MKLAFIVALLTLPVCLQAEELIRDAKVIEVANTNSNGADFAIILERGTGVC